MTRKSPQELMKNIILSLQESPKTINQIKKELGIEWATAKSYLETLEEINLVKESKIGRSRTFELVENRPIAKDNDTYFGLPMSHKDKQISWFLFSEISKEWEKRFGKKSDQIATQKVAVEVANRLNLNVPISWYKYGKILVCRYEPQKEYSYDKIVIDKSIDIYKFHKILEEVCGLFSDCITFHDFMRKQYELSEHPLYKTKLDFEDMFFKEENKEIKNKHINLAYDLIFNYPDLKEDSVVKELLEAFVSSYVTSILQGRHDPKIRNMAFEAFSALWALMALRQFKRGLVSGGFYKSETDIQKYIECEEQIYTRDANDAVLNFVKSVYG
ncbi:MAG: winged helix-turn-helix domain-containing protein [Candidatus Methanofastidiosia archaeon]